jgi:Gpi18-like mannosyltransferase
MAATVTTGQIGAPSRRPAVARVVAPTAGRLGAVVAYLRRRDVRFLIAIYAAARLLLLLVAVVDDQVSHRGLAYELTNWDGVWYLRLATRGYPKVALHDQSTLGFLPLYPLIFRGLTEITRLPLTTSGLLVSGIGGLITTRNVYTLAEHWWGESVARRAALIFVFFPGAIVFSLLYSEGILLMLASSALLCLERKWFWRAGICCGLATAVGPDGLPIVLAIAVALFIEMRGTWTARQIGRAVGVLAVSVSGIASAAVFFWVWCGTPLASWRAQRLGWGEETNLFALVHQTVRLYDEFATPHLTYHDLNWNLVMGEIGTIVLIFSLIYCWRYRREIGPAALAFALGIAVLCVTSQFVPPNPRLLLSGFPLIVVFARRLSGRPFALFLSVNVVLLIACSMLTYVGIALRP